MNSFLNISSLPAEIRSKKFAENICPNLMGLSLCIKRSSINTVNMTEFGGEPPFVSVNAMSRVNGFPMPDIHNKNKLSTEVNKKKQIATI